MSVPATIPQTLTYIIKYVRRICKTPNTEDVTDETIVDYVNRFYTFDVPERIQLFQLKTQYSFETDPNIDRYQLPINTYNMVETPCFVDGYRIVWQQSTDSFNKLFPNLYNNQQWQLGDGTGGPYSINLASLPVVRGFTDLNGVLDSTVFVTAVDVNGNQLVLQDDGSGSLQGDGTGTVNYITGAISASFTNPIPATSYLHTQSIPYTAGRPQAVLFYDTIFTLRPVPDKAYKVQMDAYYTPAAFLNTVGSVPYSWMAEYIARGAARKILNDFGDAEQSAFYEPMFREQENLVLRRTGRQNSVVRNATIFMGQTSPSTGLYNQL